MSRRLVRPAGSLRKAARRCDHDDFPVSRSAALATLLHFLQRRERWWLAPETYTRLQRGARRLAVNSSAAVQAMRELARTVEYPRRWVRAPKTSRGSVIDFAARCLNRDLTPQELTRKVRGKIPPYLWVEVSPREKDRAVAAFPGKIGIQTAEGRLWALYLP